MAANASFPLTGLSEAQRTQALERFALLRPALEGQMTQTQHPPGFNLLAMRRIASSAATCANLISMGPWQQWPLSAVHPKGFHPLLPIWLDDQVVGEQWPDQDHIGLTLLACQRGPAALEHV